MSRATAGNDDNVAELIERMRAVRTSGGEHLEELSTEAKRLFDWKEYVRAKPLLSVTAVALVGFGAARAAISSKSSSGKLNSIAIGSTSAASAHSRFKNAMVALATTFVTSTIKNYLATHSLRGFGERNSHDRLRDIGEKS